MHHHDHTVVSSGCAWHAAFIVQEQKILILMLQGWQQNFNLGTVLVMKKWNAWSAGGMHVCCNSANMWTVKVMNLVRSTLAVELCNQSNEITT